MTVYGSPRPTPPPDFDPSPEVIPSGPVPSGPVQGVARPDFASAPEPPLVEPELSSPPAFPSAPAFNNGYESPSGYEPSSGPAFPPNPDFPDGPPSAYGNPGGTVYGAPSPEPVAPSPRVDNDGGMYSLIWRILPFGLPGKIIGSLALVTLAAYLLWFYVFPWAEPILPFDNSQISDPGGGNTDVVDPNASTGPTPS